MDNFCGATVSCGKQELGLTSRRLRTSWPRLILFWRSTSSLLLRFLFERALAVLFVQPVGESVGAVSKVLTVIRLGECDVE